MKRILIIDGQGGMLGKELAMMITENFRNIEVNAVGTNSIATANMIKVKGVNGATGENALIVMSKKVDIIVGPIGIVVADSLMGEITPDMAKAVGQSEATKVLLPVNRCNNIVVGTEEKNIKELLTDTVDTIRKLIR